MSSKIWRELTASPLVVLPAFGVAFGLTLVPLVLFGSDHAAEFYGSVFSAMATVVAVFAAGYLARKNAEEERHQRILESATEFYFWSHKCILRIVYDQDRLQLVLQRIRATGPDAKIALRDLKNRIVSVNPVEASAQIALATKFPSHISAKVIPILHLLANQAVFMADTNDRVDTALLDANQLERLVSNCDGMKRLLAGAAAEIRPFLLEEEMFTEAELLECEEILVKIAQGVEALRSTSDPN